MKKFIFKIVLNLILLVLLLIPPSLILKYSRENFNDLKNLIKKKDDYLIGYFYNENNYN